MIDYSVYYCEDCDHKVSFILGDSPVDIYCNVCGNKDLDLVETTVFNQNGRLEKVP